MAHPPVVGLAYDVSGLRRFVDECHPLYKEMYNLIGTNVETQIKGIVEDRVPFGTLTVDGILMAAGGINPPAEGFRRGQVGYPWWMFTNALTTHPRAAVRVLQEVGPLMDSITPKVRRLESWVWTKYPMGFKFVKACGFTLEDTIVWRGRLETRDCWRENPCA